MLLFPCFATVRTKLHGLILRSRAKRGVSKDGHGRKRRRMRAWPMVRDARPAAALLTMRSSSLRVSRVARGQHGLERHPRPRRRAGAEGRIGFIDAARDVALGAELAQNIGGLL